jgi:hypothetical protein
LWKVAHAVFLLSLAAAERVSESEHDDFGDGDAFDEQEGAIGAKDPQRAFDLAPPVKRQFAGYDFDELKICVRSLREEGRVPHQAATIMAKAPTSAAPLNAPRPAARPMNITCRFTIEGIASVVI